MTDNEIIKALECCKGGFCCGCPRLSNNMGAVACMRELTNQTLDLINRQQAEIERLKAGVNVDLENYASEYDSKIKAEAIKEYKEKLKEHAYLDSGITGFQEMVVDLSDIENIADEMVGEDK